ncbi:hypothetical protein IscW_ISCW009043 [Ixodes scapularis]|uniref:Uncharacterized protein n=1 Tax=Ixodes scapularis TaxID=6945 RepID=B7PYA9_IXOSC|nr:hypothetical protein IscW_ISCW009043 [Ixodes scapularis]|eukprot:XP_002402781.1 hypothetical protein IscW_ISCW009043 [Ixodes scapularis]
MCRTSRCIAHISPSRRSACLVFGGETRKSLDCNLRQDGGKRGGADNIWVFDSALHGATEC